MKIYLRTVEGKDEDAKITESECSSLEEVNWNKNVDKEQYIHYCHHDENPPKPCTLEKI